MIPDAFHVERYRGFAARARVELRPLTLIFGANNSGKSALVRFLPLLAESVDARGSALRVDGDVTRRARFSDIANRALGPQQLSFGFEWPDQNVEWTLRAEDRGARVDRLVSRGRVEFAEDFDAPDPRIRGWVPPSEWIGRDLLPFREAVQWMHGSRRSAERYRDLPVSAPGLLAPDGSDATDPLALDGDLDPINGFYQRLGLTLSVYHRNEQYGLAVASSADPGTAIPLADSGEGLAQVLPILVAIRQAGRGGAPVVAMEQPELHLHTSAQRALAEHLCTAARAGEARLLVETHSEILLAAVQLSVVKGLVDPSRVAVYWTVRDEEGRTSVEPIEIRRDGRLEGAWPSRAFADLAELTREVLRARRGP